MKFQELTEEEFRTFLDEHPLKTFIQTPEMTKIREHFGYTPYYVGVKENEIIIAATMIGSKKSHFGFYEFYAPRGLLVDYENYDVLFFFTKELKKFVKEKKGYVLRIDPYYIKEEKDIDGNVVQGGINHTLGIQNLNKVGFRKCNTIYQQFQYMFCLDLDETKDSLYHKFHTLPKRMIKKAMENHIVIREASFDELNKVERLINETSERKSFHARDLNYYKLLYEQFYPKNEVKFMLGEMDVKAYQSAREEALASLEKELPQLTNQAKIDIYKNKIEKEKKLLEESNQLPMNEDGKLLISAGVFILYGSELIYLFGGNKKEYMQYGSSYLMQWQMMQLGIEQGFTKYNFYGISKPSKEDGVYNFKRGFSGYVEELIGDYELPVNGYYYINKLFHTIKK